MGLDACATDTCMHHSMMPTVPLGHPLSLPCHRIRRRCAQVALPSLPLPPVCCHVRLLLGLLPPHLTRPVASPSAPTHWHLAESG